MKSGLRFSLALSACLLTAAPARESLSPSQGPPRVHIEPLAGSTGGSMAALVQADLQASGALALTADRSNALVIGGTVTGTRLEAHLTDPAGTELLRTLYDGPDLRRGAHELADDIVFALTGRPGIATSRIAFVSDVSGRPEIYVCEADGRERRRVTYDGALAAHPSIDRLGALLTYTSHRGAQSEVFALDLMGGARRRLESLQGGSHGAALSPDARRLALCLTRETGPTVTVVSLDEADPTDGRHTRPMSRPGSLPSSPAWSPDGARVIFSCDEGDGSGPQLHEARAGHRARRLDLGVPNAFSPDWSPDGTRLVFVTRQRNELWLALWDRQASRVRLLTPGRDPCWGADSRHVLYTTGERLVAVNVDSIRHRTILENFGRLSEPSWTK